MLFTTDVAEQFTSINNANQPLSIKYILNNYWSHESHRVVTKANYFQLLFSNQQEQITNVKTAKTLVGQGKASDIKLCSFVIVFTYIKSRAHDKRSVYPLVSKGLEAVHN